MSFWKNLFEFLAKSQGWGSFSFCETALDTAMIQKISIENYKSIKMLSDFELKPVNILIGANNSGKSNFLDVFAFLRDTLQLNSFNDDQSMKNLRAVFFKRGDVIFHNENHLQFDCVNASFDYFLKFWRDPFANFGLLSVERLSTADRQKVFFELDRGNNNHGMLISEDRKAQESYMQQYSCTGLSHYLRGDNNSPQVEAFAKQLAAIKVYDRMRTEQGSPLRMPQASKGEEVLAEDGSNLVSVLHQLSQNQPRFLVQLNSLLRVVFDDFAEISFRSSNSGEVFIDWRDTNGRFSNVSQLSDGTLKFLCLVAILRNPNPPALIGIDEVDANLHPKMQAILADLIDEASSKTQIVATTHNPDFISMFKPDEIVILQRHKGATEMRRFSTKGALDLWLEDFTTRELWLMGELESRW